MRSKLVVGLVGLLVGLVLAACGGEPIAGDETARDEQAAAEQARRDAEAREAERAAQARAEAERRRRERGETARVTDVIDGDTVEMAGVGRVRLIGVDTPERGEECFDEATAYLERRVGGKTVRYRLPAGPHRPLRP